ncbi:Glutathione S-transferase Mu 2 [Taenia solium]|eukprot:TsM_001037400 transcript=TsM_001037400 gene=TsM_001037400
MSDLHPCTAIVPTLGYWDIKGLGEQIRILLKYLGVEFIDKRYNFGPAPAYDRSAWLSEKFLLDLDFPNLPYYIDGDFKLTQSGAIMRYIADIHGMIPDCKEQRALLHMLQDEVDDLRTSFMDIYYRPDCVSRYSMDPLIRISSVDLLLNPDYFCLPQEELKPGFLETLAQRLPRFEAFMGEKQWFSGEKASINYPDFALCDLLMQMTKLEPTYLKEYPKLQAYLSRFQNLPEMRDYMIAK